MYREKVDLGNIWIPIYQDLEVSFRWSTCYCKEPSKIAFRSTNNSIKQVKLCVQAEGCFDGNFRKKYHETLQQEFTFQEVTTGMKSEYLRLPKIDFWALENGNVIFSFEKLSMTVVSIAGEKIDKEINLTNALSYAKNTFLTDDARENWGEKAGRHYHIGKINDDKYRLKKRIYADYEYSSVFLKGLRRSLWLRNEVFAVHFWLLVILQKYNFNEDGELEFEQYFFL